jgi:hypothetical protein
MDMDFSRNLTAKVVETEAAAQRLMRMLAGDPSVDI